MKKNININLSGQLYAIDEDAYQILKSYLDSMESYFLRQEGGNEIAEVKKLNKSFFFIFILLKTREL